MAPVDGVEPSIPMLASLALPGDLWVPPPSLAASCHPFFELDPTSGKKVPGKRSQQGWFQ